MTLIETEDLIAGGFGSRLDRNHSARLGREGLLVGWVLELAIPFVAGALARVLTAVRAVAEAASFGLRVVVLNIRIHNLICLYILNTTRQKL